MRSLGERKAREVLLEAHGEADTITRRRAEPLPGQGQSADPGAPIERPRRAGWVEQVALAIACSLGAVVSGLSTRDHVRYRVSDEAGACAALIGSGCKAAHTSNAAEIWGVPISHLGTAFYLAGVGLAVFALIVRRRQDAAGTGGVAALVILMGLGSVGYSVYLASLLIRAGEACPFCIALYCVNAAMLALGAVWWLRGERRISVRSLVVPGLVVLGVGGVAFGGSTPFLIKALSEIKPFTVKDAVNPGGKMLPPLAVPSRVPAKGSTMPTADIVEFSDLDCPHCAALHRTVTSLREEPAHGGMRVRFVNYPLDQSCNPHVARSLHPSACLAARGGICAQEQGRFWPYSERYFAQPEPRTRETVLAVAREVGADMERFATCIDSEEASRSLAQDIGLAHAASVRATPTLLINGWTFEGALPRERLLRILDETTPCGCDQRSPDGACETGVGPASAERKE